MNNKNQIAEFIGMLLCDTYLHSFNFCQSYTLTFRRERTQIFQGVELPQYIDIFIESDWWFNSKEEWRERIKHFPTSNSPDNEEPIIAYELAMIMWSEDNKVEKVNLFEDRMEIQLRSKRIININNEVSESDSWLMYESGIKEQQWKWHVVCSGDGEVWSNIIEI